MTKRSLHLDVVFTVGLVGLLTLAVACEPEPPEDTSDRPTDSAESDGDDPGDVPRDGDPDDTAEDGGDAVTGEIPTVRAEPVVSDDSFNQPIFVTQPPGESDTLFVVERPGRIVRVENGEIQSPPFLDIQDRVSTAGNERGLLGLAFHPDYQTNGKFYVNYTPTTQQPSGFNMVAEYQRKSNDPDVAESNPTETLVRRRDSESNHNGGMVAFGPDGHLYVGMGDGGSGCDAGLQHSPQGNGQDVSNVFGTLLRLDVDAPDRDFAPADNPFVGSEGKDQIWAYGLRNPWRFGFDPKTGDLYIGDVGQDAIEEIDFQSASSDGGDNYGWRGYEGTEKSSISGCDDSGASDIEDHAEPIFEYRHGRAGDAIIRGGGSVTGGYVYRGDDVPELRGYYVYGDYESGDVAALRYVDGSIVDHERLEWAGDRGRGLASFGQDNAGEIYLVFIRSGDVMKLRK